MSYRAFRAYVLVSCFLISSIGHPDFARAVCPGAAIGVPIGVADRAETTLLGSAKGQTFLAAYDTLISSISVWRVPLQTPVGLQLFVTRVDSLGRPISEEPRTSPEVIPYYIGPTVSRYDSDPPGLPVEIRFDLEPPLALPSRGMWAFFVQPEACWPGGYPVMVDTSNSYPAGAHTWTTRSHDLYCWHLPPLLGVSTEGTDMIFRIEFCEAPVPTSRKTWGELKLLYR